MPWRYLTKTHWDDEKTMEGTELEDLEFYIIYCLQRLSVLPTLCRIFQKSLKDRIKYNK